MKKLILSSFAAALFSTPAMAVVYTSSDTPLPVPPVGSTGTTTSTISVPDSGIISDTAVTISGDHTFSGDLDISITSPSGTVAGPFDATPGGSVDWTGESYSLSTFNGENLFGDWLLTIDDILAGDNGVLTSWSLNIESISASVPDGGNNLALFGLALPALIALRRRLKA